MGIAADLRHAAVQLVDSSETGFSQDTEHGVTPMLVAERTGPRSILANDGGYA